MSNEDIVKLIQDGTDVTANQEKLWFKNRGLIKHVVRKVCGDTKDAEDFEQQGFIGLITAAMKYNPAAGASFATYAVYHIRAAIIRYSENCCRSVRTPQSTCQRIRKYEHIRQQFRNDKGREPSEDEYMEQLGISMKSLRHIEKTIHNMKTVSVDMGMAQSDGETSLLDMLQSDEDVEELVTYSVYYKELKAALDSALSILDAETRSMIQNVYYQGNTREQTAAIYNCSKQNVCDMIDSGFWKILHSAHRENLESFMWDGYKFNESRYSQYAALSQEDEENEFLI